MPPRQLRGEQPPVGNPALAALMATALYGALVVCVDGFLSLATNTDVISDPAVGPLIGPIMALVSCALVFRAVYRGFFLDPRRTAVRALITGVLVYVVATLVGAMLFAIGTGEPLATLFFLTQYLASPYVLSAAILAVIVVALVPLIAGRKLVDRR